MRLRQSTVCGNTHVFASCVHLTQAGRHKKAYSCLNAYFSPAKKRQKSIYVVAWNSLKESAVSKISGWCNTSNFASTRKQIVRSPFKKISSLSSLFPSQLYLCCVLYSVSVAAFVSPSDINGRRPPFHFPPRETAAERSVLSLETQRSVGASKVNREKFAT